MRPLTDTRLSPPVVTSESLERSVVRTGWQWLFAIRSEQTTTNDAGVSTVEPSTRRTPKLARMEAALLVAEGAVSFRKLAQFATLTDVAEARKLVAELNDSYDASDSAFRIEHVAGGCRLMTRPQFALWLDRLHNRQARVKLSPPMLETLSIVACRQPVTRAEIERIRGVQASEMLKQLMERGLVRITGEDDSLGRPFLYGTTRQFLEEFGFGSLNDLPVDESLRRTRETPEAPEADPEVTSDESDDVAAEDDVEDTAETSGDPAENAPLKQAG